VFEQLRIRNRKNGVASPQARSRSVGLSSSARAASPRPRRGAGHGERSAASFVIEVTNGTGVIRQFASKAARCKARAAFELIRHNAERNPSAGYWLDGTGEGRSFPMPQKKNQPDKRQDKDEPQLWWDPAICLRQ
jgi:hypothetical protein